MEPAYTDAAAYARKILEEELPDDRVYHDIEHTENVVETVDTLYRMEGLSDDEGLLLKTAAWYHDIGHVEGAEDHEERGAAVVRDVLPAYGYEEEQIDEIVDYIMATELPQQPGSVGEEIMCDADLANFGRDDFVESTLAVKQEAGVTDIIEWYRGTRDLMQQHRYFTDSANELYGAKKRKNLEAVERFLTNVDTAKELVERVDDGYWAVTGSTNLALQGVPVLPDDLDIHVREGRLQDFVDALVSYDDVIVETEPGWSETDRMRGNLAVLRLDEVAVDVQEEIAVLDGGWEKPFDEVVFDTVAVDGRDVPVIPLEAEYRKYSGAGRKLSGLIERSL